MIEGFSFKPKMKRKVEEEAENILSSDTFFENHDPPNKQAIEEGWAIHDRANKSQHNVVFSAWLVRQFGQSGLRSGSGVIDIAGGCGLLSYELTVRYGVQSTVIDPRFIKLNSMLRRKIRKVTKNRTTSSSADNTTAMSPLFRLLQDHNLVVRDDALVLDGVSNAIEDKDALPFNHICAVFEPGDVQQNDLISSAAILVGMHSDQVTEAIVDTALKTRKAFAVVPCCVFPRMFPDRKTAAGTTVSSYEDFLDYLQCKDPLIKRASLPFIGRNIILYRESLTRMCGEK